MEQYYENIPVYGKSVIISADEEGNAAALTSNYIKVDNKIDLIPSVTDEEINESLQKFFDDDSLNTQLAQSKECVIYTLENEKTVLAYEMIIGSCDIIVDAHTAEVLHYTNNIDNATAKVYSPDGMASTDGWRNDDGSYHLYNDEYKISMFDVDGITTVINKKGQVHTDFTDYNIDTMYSSNNVFDKKAIETANKIITVNNYFRDLGDSGFDRIHVAINDSYSNGSNARGGGGYEENADTYAIMLFGSQFDYNDMDVVAHEYTHAVSYKTVKWSGKTNKNGTSPTVKDMWNHALNEAFSDIFGVLIENTQNPDWDIKFASKLLRDISDPSKTGCFSNVSEVNSDGSDDYYTVSTIISHSAYLMNNGIDGDGTKKIDGEKLAELWFRAMNLLHSDADFNQCAYYLTLSAEKMMRDKELTPCQFNCVIEALLEVGISTTYSVKSGAHLYVNDINLNSYNNYHMTISTINNIREYLETESLGKTVVDIDVTNSDGYVLDLNPGTYYIKITDNNENGSQNCFTKIINVVDNIRNKYLVASNSLNIYTDFGDSMIKLNSTFANYLTNSLIPMYGKEASFCRTMFDSINIDSQLSWYTQAYKGILSAYTDDLNDDGAEEMITFRIENNTIYIDLYTLNSSNNEVNLSANISSYKLFSSVGNNIYIGFSSSENKTYLLVSGNDFYGGSSASSAISEFIDIYSFDSDGNVNKEKSISYKYAHGDEIYYCGDKAYKICVGGGEIHFDEQEEAKNDINTTLQRYGISMINLEESLSVFVKNLEEEKKILECGSNFLEESDIEIFLKDYTCFHIPVTPEKMENKKLVDFIGMTVGELSSLYGSNYNYVGSLSGSKQYISYDGEEINFGCKGEYNEGGVPSNNDKIVIVSYYGSDNTMGIIDNITTDTSFSDIKTITNSTLKKREIDDTYSISYDIGNFDISFEWFSQPSNDKRPDVVTISLSS